MARIVKGLFGGKSKAEKILRRFQPTGFTAPGLTGRFDKAANEFTLTRTGEGAQTIADLRTAFEGRAAEFRGLRSDVRPGFGRLTQARVEAIRAAGQRTVGNLREELAKRRVLGSTFASREIASVESEFGRQEEFARAESFLQELGLTGELIKDEFSSLISGFETILGQFNFETGLAANLATNASAQLNANLTAQAEARSIQQAVGEDFLGTALGFIFSDRRLKTNIQLIGSVNGYNWYSFDYIWGQSSQGVMADEVPERFVHLHSSGYAMVDYGGLLNG